MIESTLLGAALGFLGRMAPDLLKAIDRHLERRHELAMQETARKYDAQRGNSGKVEEIGGFSASPVGAQMGSMLDALRESWKSQMESKDPKVARISSLVRPATTYILLGLYCGAKVLMLVYAIATGKLDVVKAYSADDAALLSGVLAYWFLSRTIDKAK